MELGEECFKVPKEDTLLVRVLSITEYLCFVFAYSEQLGSIVTIEVVEYSSVIPGRSSKSAEGEGFSFRERGFPIGFCKDL
jgi:hypothetical protein